MIYLAGNFSANSCFLVFLLVCSFLLVNSLISNSKILVYPWRNSGGNNSSSGPLYFYLYVFLLSLPLRSAFSSLIPCINK